MPVFPYKLRPVAPRVAVLLDEGAAFVEGMGTIELDALPADVRVFSDFDKVSSLLADGHGEALAWNLEPIKWRHRRGASPWQQAPHDVRVVHVPFPDRADVALEGLRAWRDWLASYGASPLSSLGSSGFSLLRATLEEPLWTAVGEVPPFRFTLGGRQQMGPRGACHLEGTVRNYDLPAAYAETLAGLAYGGHWRQVPPAAYPWQRTAERGQLAFVRARVKVPELLYGPLPRRPRRVPDPSGWDSVFDPVVYPVATTMQGTWSWPEVRTALELGCELVKVLDVWVHATTADEPRPFGPWWAAVQDGRSMRGFAGTLAKATGNALWGQFCISLGRRDVVRWDGGERVLRPSPSHGSRPRAFDLAEQITGSVRARMARFMHDAGERLVCAHTDGGWLYERVPSSPAGFRQKAVAGEADVVNPQLMRYREAGTNRWAYVVSGVPPRLAPETFERAWAELEQQRAPATPAAYAEASGGGHPGLDQGIRSSASPPTCERSDVSPSSSSSSSAA